MTYTPPAAGAVLNGAGAFSITPTVAVSAAACKKGEVPTLVSARYTYVNFFLTYGSPNAQYLSTIELYRYQ